MGNGSAMAFCDSENIIYQVEDEGEKDCEVPGKLAIFLQQEERNHSAPRGTYGNNQPRYRRRQKKGQGGCQSGTRCQGASDLVITRLCLSIFLVV